MKKLLALVLALVMTLSLCTVTNAAYPDAADVDYKEAVDVMSAVGVFQGDEKGNFNPDAILTRETAAKLIAYLDLGAKTAEALPAVKVFSDVEANRWSAKYVAYCADAGYIAGVGDGSYNPTGELTGYAFGKLLLCVLGYDANIEGFTGAAWSINVAKLMEKNGIAADVDTAASAALSREAAAQYCLNALKADCVEYENKGTNVTINGAVIATGASAPKAVEVSATAPDYNASGDKVQQLCEKLYKKDLLLTDGNDALGRPADVWSYKTEEVGKYAEEADVTLVAKKAYADAKAAYIDLKDEDYSKAAPTTKVNGAAGTAIEKGDVIEYYITDGVLKTAAVTRYTLGKVTKVDTKVTKAEAKDDVTCKITVKTLDEASTLVNAFADTKFADFSYAKGDVILFAKNSTDDKVIASKLADSVEGKVTATKSGKAAIDGTYYDTLVALALDAEGTFYMNAAGQIIDKDAKITKSSDYAYLYKIDSKTGLNAEGINTTTVTAYYVDQTGAKASAVVDEDSVSAATEGKVVAYKINSDKELEVVAGEDTIETIATVGADGVDKDNAKIADGIFANGTTKFVFAKEDGSKMKVSTVDGYKNVKIAKDTKVIAVTDSKDYAVYAFVLGTNGNVEDTGYVAVMLDNVYEVTKDTDNTYYTFSVAVDGKETTLTTKATAQRDKLAALDKGDVFTYDLESNYAANVAALTSAQDKQTVAAANSEYIMVGSKQYNTGDETVYTITREFDGATVDTVSVSAGGSYSTDNKVSFTLTSGGDLKVTFIYDDIK